MNWFETWFNEDYLELYSHRDGHEACLQVEFLLNALHLPNPAATYSVLDVACGTGRHVREFATRGFVITGVDLSRHQIAEAKRLLLKIPEEKVSFICSDNRALPFENCSFDILCSWFNSFGYLKTEDENLALLVEWYRVLRPGGVFALDFFNREEVLRTLVPESRETLHGKHITQTRALSADGLRLEKRICISPVGKPEEEKEYRESVRLYSQAEILYLIQQAGFEVQGVHRYQEPSLSRAVLTVARKRETS